MRNRTSLADWHDLRAEAWQTGAVEAGFWIVDNAKTQPLATGQVQWVDGARTLDGVDLARRGSIDSSNWPAGQVTLTGVIRLHPTTKPIQVFAALTGVAPDGRRYLLGYPAWAVCHFDGTALDWYQQILAGH
jgi:hypothetical protein